MCSFNRCESAWGLPWRTSSSPPSLPCMERQASAAVSSPAWQGWGSVCKSTPTDCSQWLVNCSENKLTPRLYINGSFLLPVISWHVHRFRAHSSWGWASPILPCAISPSSHGWPDRQTAWMVVRSFQRCLDRSADGAIPRLPAITTRSRYVVEAPSPNSSPTSIKHFLIQLLGTHNCFHQSKNMLKCELGLINTINLAPS